MKTRRPHPTPQTNMFSASAQDLPLFSGTPMRDHESKYQPRPAVRQPSLFGCPVCQGTGKYNGKRCTCQM